MKAVLNFFALILASAIFLPSCGTGGGGAEEGPKCTVSPDSVAVGYEGGSVQLNVVSEREWTAFSDDEWIDCDVDLSNGYVLVEVEANSDYRTREGTVVVKAGITRVKVPVTQQTRPETPTDPDIEVPEGYRLVWQDEFDEGDSPDTDLWYFETGDHGWGNNELQNYVAGSINGENLASVEGGILTITAKKIDGQVCSIRMNTRESWKYGWFEARLRLPSGKGTWPAFWMLPEDFSSWPLDGEIDIMEEVGYDPNNIVSTIHCQAYNHGIGTQKSGTRLIPTAQTEFHVYACEWTEDYIRMMVDGEEIFRFRNDGTGNKETWPFNVPFYLKLNLAWGGNWGGAQGVDESVLPATYEIDYVRVFEKK